MKNGIKLVTKLNELKAFGEFKGKDDKIYYFLDQDHNRCYTLNDKKEMGPGLRLFLAYGKNNIPIKCHICIYLIYQELW